MNRAKWFFHPIFVLLSSTLALGLSLFLYIYWYVEVSAGLQAVVKKFNLSPDQVLEPQTWVVILVLSILVCIILMGIFIIYVYNHKTFQLYRLQNNFINNFTHELKTPVTSLHLYLETFLKHDLPKQDQHNYIRYMLADVNRLSNTISSILNLARLESKGFGGERVEVDLVSVIESFCDANQHLFKNCRITIHSSGKPFFYPIDRSLFEMLLMNLLTNGMKYNNSSQPKIDIHFETRIRKMDIHFVDNGIGLPKKELKKIFKKFYQAGRAENMSAVGSGLGLYLTQSIARFHEGKIKAESEGVGKGAVFTLVLPHKFRRNEKGTP